MRFTIGLFSIIHHEQALLENRRLKVSMCPFILIMYVFYKNIWKGLSYEALLSR